MLNILLDNEKQKYSFDDLVRIIESLRAPNGCPWDREQTHKSIRNEFIEETYEAVDAIDRGNSTDLCEELGDVLLQVLMHAQMSREAEEFDITDVIDGIARKMVLRHPHVFGTVKADTTEKVLENWDKIKRVEKHQLTVGETLSSVPMSYPALMRAGKVQKRAAKAGAGILDNDEALCSFKTAGDDFAAAVKKSDSDIISQNYGKMLFAAVNVARLNKIDSEESLNRITDKFISDFKRSEEKL